MTHRGPFQPLPFCDLFCSPSPTPAPFCTAGGAVREGGCWGRLRSGTQAPGSQASSASPAARWANCYLLPLQVERCWTAGLYNALKSPSTALGPEPLLLSCPGTAPSRRRTNLPNRRKQGKETRRYFCYIPGKGYFWWEPPWAKVLLQKRQGSVKSRLWIFRTCVHTPVVLSFGFALSVIPWRLVEVSQMKHQPSIGDPC